MGGWSGYGEDHVGMRRRDLLREFRQAFRTSFCVTSLDQKVLAFCEAKSCQFRCDRLDRTHDRIVGETSGEKTKPVNPARLLRSCCERPHSGRAKTNDNRPPFHSITSSARMRMFGGIVRPRARAVFRLT